VRELLEHGVDQISLRPVEPSQDSPPVPEAALARASAADVAEALRDEPDWLVALVLAKRRWPWDSDYLARLEPARLESCARSRALSARCQATRVRRGRRRAGGKIGTPGAAARAADRVRRGSGGMMAQRDQDLEKRAAIWQR